MREKRLFLHLGPAPNPESVRRPEAPALASFFGASRAWWGFTSQRPFPFLTQNGTFCKLLQPRKKDATEVGGGGWFRHGIVTFGSVGPQPVLCSCWQHILEPSRLRVKAVVLPLTSGISGIVHFLGLGCVCGANVGAVEAATLALTHHFPQTHLAHNRCSVNSCWLTK